MNPVPLDMKVMHYCTYENNRIYDLTIIHSFIILMLTIYSIEHYYKPASSKSDGEWILASGEYLIREIFFSVSDTSSSKEKIQVHLTLPKGVEPSDLMATAE